MTNILEQTAATWPIALQRFGWNPSGTMAWELIAPLPHSNTVPTRNMTYDADNRLTSYNGTTVATDANGNMTYGAITNDVFGSYVYDARNRLTSAGGQTYGYDALNNRVSMTNGANVTKFTVNPATLSQVLMRTKNGVTTYYVYGRGLLYEVEQDNTTRTYHFDSRGSTIAITDDGGNVTDRVEYSAYGITTYRAGNTDTPFLFNGYYGVQTDSNGLLYMRARYYNPWICRFINPDPSGFSGGLNHYAYANGNPISLVDPFGLCVTGLNTGDSWIDGYGTIHAYSDASFGDIALASLKKAVNTPLEALGMFGGFMGYLGQQVGLDPNETAILLAFAAMPEVSLGRFGTTAASVDTLGSLTPAQARLIQSFSDRFGSEVNLVGSRAAGGGLTSDFDYVIGGNSSLRNSAQYYLPRGPLGTGANGRGVDIFNANLTPLDITKPYIQFTPGNSPVIGSHP